jgi:pyrroline-5-carboxylate reductase
LSAPCIKSDAQVEVRAAGGAPITAAINAIAESLANRGSLVAADEAFRFVRAVLHGTVDLVHEQEMSLSLVLSIRQSEILS